MVIIEKAKEILKSIYQRLKTAECLSEANVILGYPKDVMPNPLKKALVACNLYNMHVSQDVDYTNGIKEVEYTYIVDLYVPTVHTGSGCMDLLIDISDVLLLFDNGETQRTSEISSVQYDSNGRAFHAKLYLKLCYDKNNNLTQLKENIAKVHILVDQKILAYSRSVVVKAKKNTYDICVYGEKKPVDSVITSNEYTISIKRLIKSIEEVELQKLKNFEVLIKAGTRQVIYSNCNWVEIEESTDNEKYSCEKAVIYSNAEKVAEERADD